MQISRLTATALIIAASAPAFALGPYAPVPPGYGSPAFMPLPGGAWGGPVPFAAPISPYGPPPRPDRVPVFLPPPAFLAPDPPGANQEAPRDQSAIVRGERRHLSISRRAEPDAYLIEIRLRNIDPDEVRIVPQGRGLRIGYQTRAEDRREDRFDGGYSGSYSVVGGSASQRLPLPPDADLAAMSRTATDDAIALRIPRLDRTRSMPW